MTTKKELEKEAFEYAYNKTQKLHSSSERDFVYKIYLEIAEPREKRIEELEKENAELKRENRGIKTCTNCDEYVIGRCCNYPNGVCHHWKLSEKYRNDDKLTEAKALIKNLMYTPRECIPWYDLFNKAKQFLKEIENER